MSNQIFCLHNDGRQEDLDFTWEDPSSPIKALRAKFPTAAWNLLDMDTEQILDRDVPRKLFYKARPAPASTAPSSAAASSSAADAAAPSIPADLAGRTGAIKRKKFNNPPSQHIMKTIRSNFTLLQAVLELLDNSFESLILAINEGRFQRGVTTGCIKLQVDVARRTIRVLDNGRGLTFEQFEEFRVGSSQHKDERQRQRPAASAGATSREDAPMVPTFFSGMFSSFGVGSKGAASELNKERGDLNIYSVDCGDRGCGCGPSQTCGGCMKKLTIPLAENAIAAKNNDRDGEWAVYVEASAPDAQLKEACKMIPGWGGERFTCFEVTDVDGAFLRSLQSSPQLHKFCDDICKTYAPYLTNSFLPTVKFPTERIPQVKLHLELIPENASRPITLDSDDDDDDDLEPAEPIRICLNEWMLESDGSTYNKFMTARQIGAVARQGPGSSSAAPTQALEPFVHRGMYTTEGGEVGHYCYIGHYYRTSDGEPTIPPEEGGQGYGGCTEVRWLGRLLADENGAYVKRFLFTNPEIFKILNRSVNHRLNERVWLRFHGTLLLSGDFPVRPNKNMLLGHTNSSSEARFELVNALCRPAYLNTQRSGASASSTPRQSPARFQKDRKRLDEEAANLFGEWLTRMSSLDEETSFIWVDVERTPEGFATTKHVRYRNEELVALRSDAGNAGLPPGAKGTIPLYLKVLPIGEKDEKKAHWAEAIDFVFHNGSPSAETLGEPELKELCQKATTGFVRYRIHTHEATGTNNGGYWDDLSTAPVEQIVYRRDAKTSIVPANTNAGFEAHIRRCKKKHDEALPKRIMLASDVEGCIDVNESLPLETAYTNPGKVMLRIVDGKGDTIKGLRESTVVLKVNGASFPCRGTQHVEGIYQINLPGLVKDENKCVVSVESDLFPRITTCSFAIQVLPATRPHTISVSWKDPEEHEEAVIWRLGESLPAIKLEAFDIAHQPFCFGTIGKEGVRIQASWKGNRITQDLTYRQLDLETDMFIDDAAEPGVLTITQLSLEGLLNLGASVNSREVTISFGLFEFDDVTDAPLKLNIKGGPAQTIELKCDVADADNVLLDTLVAGANLPELELAAFDEYENPTSANIFIVRWAPEACVVRGEAAASSAADEEDGDGHEEATDVGELMVGTTKDRGAKKGKLVLKAGALRVADGITGKCTIHFRAGDGDEAELSFNVELPPIASLKLELPETVNSGQPFEAIVRAYDDGEQEVEVPDDLRLEAIGRPGAENAAHALPALVVRGWRRDGCASVATCTLTGMRGGVLLQLTGDGEELADLGHELPVEELELEGGLPAAIQFDEPRAVTNGCELELHAWLVDSEGNPCDEQAARAFTWKLEAFDDELVMLPVQKHGARPLRLNGSEVTMRYGVLATSPLSTDFSVKLTCSSPSSAARASRELEPDEDVTIQLVPSPSIPSKLIVTSREAAGMAAFGEDVVNTGLSIIAGTSHLPALNVRVQAESGDTLPRPELCKLTARVVQEPGLGMETRVKESETIAGEAAFAADDLVAPKKATHARLDLKLTNFSLPKSTETAQTTANKLLSDLLRLAKRQEWQTTIKVDVKAGRASQLKPNNWPATIEGMERHSTSHSTIEALDEGGNKVEIEADVSFGLRPVAGSADDPVDGEEGPTLVLPSGALRMERGELNVETLQLINMSRSGMYEITFTAVELGGIDAPAEPLRGKASFAYICPEQAEADKREIQELTTRQKELQDELTALKQQAKEKTAESTLAGQKRTRDEGTLNAAKQTRDRLEEEYERKLRSVRHEVGLYEQLCSNVEESPLQSRQGEMARRLGELMSREQPTFSLVLDDEDQRSYTIDEIDERLLEDGKTLYVRPIDDAVPNVVGIFEERVEDGTLVRTRRGTTSVTTLSERESKISKALQPGATLTGIGSCLNPRVGELLLALAGGDAALLRRVADGGVPPNESLPLLLHEFPELVIISPPPPNSPGGMPTIDGTSSLLQVAGSTVPPLAEKYGSSYLVNLVVLPQEALEHDRGAAARLILHAALGDLVVFDTVAQMHECFLEQPQLRNMAALEPLADGGFELIRNGMLRQRLPRPAPELGGLGTPPATQLRTPQVMLASHAGTKALEIKRLGERLMEARDKFDQAEGGFASSRTEAERAQRGASASTEELGRKQDELKEVTESLKRKHGAQPKKSNKKQRVSSDAAASSSVGGTSSSADAREAGEDEHEEGASMSTVVLEATPIDQPRRSSRNGKAPATS